MVVVCKLGVSLSLQVYLLDFGACRDYSKQFTDEYIKVFQLVFVLLCQWVSV